MTKTIQIHPKKDPSNPKNSLLLWKEFLYLLFHIWLSCVDVTDTWNVPSIPKCLCTAVMEVKMSHLHAERLELYPAQHNKIKKYKGESKVLWRWTGDLKTPNNANNLFFKVHIYCLYSLWIPCNWEAAYNQHKRPAFQKIQV